MSTIADSLQIAAVLAQIALLFLVLRGFVRRYVIFAIFSAAQLASALLEGWIIRTEGPQSSMFRTVYWADEVLLVLLLFLMVSTMTQRALEGQVFERMARRILNFVVLGVILLPFLLGYQRTIFSTRWFNGASQILNFGAAIMILVLWTALTGRKTKDLQLLTISAGLGIAVTGSALSFGLRTFTIGAQTGRIIANLVGLLAHLASVLIWCWAFRSSPSPQSKETPREA